MEKRDYLIQKTIGLLTIITLITLIALEAYDVLLYTDQELLLKTGTLLLVSLLLIIIDSDHIKLIHIIFLVFTSILQIFPAGSLSPVPFILVVIAIAEACLYKYLSLFATVILILVHICFYIFQWMIEKNNPGLTILDWIILPFFSLLLIYFIIILKIRNMVPGKKLDKGYAGSFTESDYLSVFDVQEAVRIAEKIKENIENQDWEGARAKIILLEKEFLEKEFTRNIMLVSRHKDQKGNILKTDINSIIEAISVILNDNLDKSVGIKFNFSSKLIISEGISMEIYYILYTLLYSVLTSIGSENKEGEIRISTGTLDQRCRIIIHDPYNCMDFISIGQEKRLMHKTTGSDGKTMYNNLSDCVEMIHKNKGEIELIKKAKYTEIIIYFKLDTSCV